MSRRTGDRFADKDMRQRSARAPWILSLFSRIKSAHPIRQAGRPAVIRGEIRMTRLLVFGLALGLSAAMAGHASAQVKLAVGGPITGGSAAFGAQIKQGTEQAVEDINAAGGILGQKIVITSIGDD